MPNFLLEHMEFLQEVYELCNTALKKAQENSLNKLPHDNPQLTLQDLKKEIRTLAKSIAKKSILKARKEISKLKLSLDHTLNDVTTNKFIKATLSQGIEDNIKTHKREQHN